VKLMPKKPKMTKQRERLLADLTRLAILRSGEKDSLSAPMRIGSRCFLWLGVGIVGIESVIQADYHAKTFTTRRRHIIEIDEQTGEVLHIHADQLVGFKAGSWESLKKSVGIEQDIGYPYIFWLYWTPGGDEMMFGYRTTYGYFEADGNWPVWLELQRLNPKVFYNHEIAPLLGSSEEEGTHALLIEREGERASDPPTVYLAEKKFIYDYFGPTS